jgi:hypothetical protein
VRSGPSFEKSGEDSGNQKKQRASKDKADLEIHFAAMICRSRRLKFRCDAMMREN